MVAAVIFVFWFLMVYQGFLPAAHKLRERLERLFKPLKQLYTRPMLTSLPCPYSCWYFSAINPQSRIPSSLQTQPLLKTFLAQSSIIFAWLTKIFSKNCTQIFELYHYWFPFVENILPILISSSLSLVPIFPHTTPQVSPPIIFSSSFTFWWYFCALDKTNNPTSLVVVPSISVPFIANIIKSIIEKWGILFDK